MDSWKKQIWFLNKASPIAAEKVVARVIENSASDNEILNKLTYFIAETGEVAKHSIAGFVMGLVPFRLRDPLARRLMTAQAAHASYLKSPRLLGHSLGGLPIFDQLCFGKHSLPFLNKYLPMISVGEAQTFIECAALLLDRTAAEVKAYLQSLPLFHPHYVNSEDDALFSPEKLNYLIFRVCDAKKIAAPENARILRLEKILMYVSNSATASLRPRIFSPWYAWHWKDSPFLPPVP